MTPIRAVSWAAVSSLPQAKRISLEDQLAENRRHIERHGATLVAELVVPGESRNIILFEEACRRIEAYGQLRDLLERKAFDVLLYLDRSRLGRKAALSMAVISLCEDAGVLCYETENPPSSMEPQQATYDDMLLGAIKSVGAQREIQKFQQRHRFGMAARAKSGLFARGAPYGWNEIFNTRGEFAGYEINKEQAAAVRLALLDLYLHQQLAFPDVAAELNRRGIASPSGQLWTRSAVQTIADRVMVYAGHYEFNRGSRTGRPLVRAPGQWPHILTEEEAALVRAERTRRVPRRRRSRRPALYAGGVLVCDKCGRDCAIAKRRDLVSGRHSILYRCGDSCPHSYISDLKITQMLQADMLRLQDDSVRAEIAAAIPDHRSSIRDKIATITGTLEAVAGKRQRLTNAYVNLGVLSDDEYQAQMRTLEVQRQTIEEEQRDLEAQLLDATGDAKRNERLDEIAREGLMMLAEGNTRRANAWMLRHYRIYIRDNEIADIQYI